MSTIEQDEDSVGGRVPGREDVLAHPEGRVAVGDGGELGADVHGARDAVAGDGIAVPGRPEAELEAVPDLEGVDPQLGLAGLEAEPGGAGAGDAEVLAGPHRAGEFDGGGEDGEAGDGERGEVAGRGVGEALGVGGEGEGGEGEEESAGESV